MSNTIHTQLSGKTIGIFFGGRSPEHDISVITGEFIIAELEKLGFQVVPVYIGHDGRWYSDQVLGKLRFFKDAYTEALTKLSHFSLDLSRSQGSLVLKEQKRLGSSELVIDYVFPAFHGFFGEDGTIQGLCEFFDVPYAAPGVYTSSLSVDKSLTKSYLKRSGIATTDFVTVTKYEWEADKQSVVDQIQQELVFPVFSKPARAGSSIGIQKVKDQEALTDAIELALYYDAKVVVENGVEPLLDLTCAVLSDGEELIASEVQQSLFDDDGILDYDKKYMEDGGTQTGGSIDNLKIPAEIPDSLRDEIQSLSKRMFTEIDANGTARFDFLYNSSSGELFANEINTLPGTLYHHLWEKSGVAISDVLLKMLAHGFQRDHERKQLGADFKSDVLNAANSMKLKQKRN